MPTRKHSLSDLGTDVLVRILRHIPFDQCRKDLPLVSKYWRRLLREPEVWHGRMSFTASSLKVHSLFSVSPVKRELGTDVLVRIFRHVSFEQCKKDLPLVSKCWRRLLREPEVWHGRMSFTFSDLKVYSLFF